MFSFISDPKLTEAIFRATKSPRQGDHPLSESSTQFISYLLSLSVVVPITQNKSRRIRHINSLQYQLTLQLPANHDIGHLAYNLLPTYEVIVHYVYCLNKVSQSLI